MRFTISRPFEKNQHLSCLRQFCYVTKLPLPDIEVILLRSTMSSLGNTPPSGDPIGSHKHFFCDLSDNFESIFKWENSIFYVIIVLKSLFFFAVKKNFPHVCRRKRGECIEIYPSFFFRRY